MRNDGLEDLRVRRTKKSLLDSLISLIGEQGYESITVKQITERAMVNRATFYLHYEDKSDLLERGIDTRLSELQDVIETPNPDPEGAIHEAPPKILVSVFEHVAENRDFYLATLGNGGVPGLVNRLKSSLEGIVRERIEFLVSQSAESPRVPVDVIIQYAAASYTGTIIWWLEQDMPFPPEEIARHYISLNVLGIYGCL